MVKEAERISFLAGASDALAKELDEEDVELHHHFPDYSKKVRKTLGEVGETERRSRLQYISREVFEFACKVASCAGDNHHCPLEYTFLSSDDSGQFSRYRIEWADVYSPICSLSEYLDEQEKLKVDEIVNALDSTMTSRKGYRQLAAADTHMVREFVVSTAKGKLTEEASKHLPPLSMVSTLLALTTSAFGVNSEKWTAGSCRSMPSSAMSPTGSKA